MELNHPKGTKSRDQRTRKQRLEHRAQLLEHIRGCPGLKTSELAELAGVDTHMCLADLNSHGRRIYSERNGKQYTWFPTQPKQAKAEPVATVAEPPKPVEPIRDAIAVASYNVDAVTGAALVHLIKAGILTVEVKR